MRAQLLKEQAPVEEAPLELAEAETPAPGRGEVRLRVSVCGVCHTDLHIVEGDLELKRTPTIPGHQIVGTVDEVGDGIDGDWLGTRVGVPWLAGSCGECKQCRNGRENLCPDARFTGWDIPGGFAEEVVVPLEAAHRLPDGIDDLQAAPLLCAGIIGYRSLRQAELEPGQRLGLYGFGASAHLAIQVARHWDCEVYVFTRSRHHRDLARELGAAWVGGAGDRPPEKLDAAVTFAPVGWIVREALEDLDHGGTLAINAIYLDEIPTLDYREHLYGERTLRSVTNFTPADAREFLELAADIPVRTRVEGFPLEEANDVLLKLKRSELEAAAALTVG